MKLVMTATETKMKWKNPKCPTNDLLNVKMGVYRYGLQTEPVPENNNNKKSTMQKKKGAIPQKSPVFAPML